MKTVTMPASKATVGEEYTTAKGSTVRVEAQKGDKTVIIVKTPGYGYKGARPIEVTGAYELTGAPGNGGNAKKEIAQAKAKAKTAAKEVKKAEKVHKAAVKAEKKSVEKRKRLPKMTKDSGTPTVVIKGVTFRENYRARLSELRAKECQAAVKDSCHCRCGGLFHGKSHKAWFEAEAELFAKLNGPVPAVKIVALAEHLSGAKVSKNL